MSQLGLLGHQPATVRELIDRMADAHSEAIFLIGPETKRELTFARFRQRSRLLARELLDLGLTKGDKVAFVLDNGLFTAELFLGAMYGGFVPVPLNVRSGSSQLAYTLNHSEAKVVFVTEEHHPAVEEVIPQVGGNLRVIRTDVDWGPLPTNAASPGAPSEEVRPDDNALLIYTSGSSGRPKGVLLSHRKVIAGGWNSVRAHDLSAADRTLCVLPLYHINAETVTLVSTLLTGGCVVMPRRFLLREFWEWIAEYRCTWSALVPAIISQLLDWIDPRAEGLGDRLSQVRFMRSSSAPLAPAMHRAFEEKFGLLLLEAMGSTQCAGNIFSNPQPPGADKIGTPGLPFGFEAKVVGPEGAEVPRRQPGEVLVRGPSVMAGYYKDPEGTAAVLDAEGWLHTGDLACVDDDGYFFIVGRAKELIIKGGTNIAPRQVDEALGNHPEVAEAAALGVPDHYLGEDVVAFVARRPAAQVTEEELRDFCEQQLGSYKTPTRIFFVNELPKGPSGKLQRLRLPECFKGILEPYLHTTRPGPSGNGRNGTAHASPVPLGPLEEMIAETWAEALAVETVGPLDNFFGLGGHSLLAIETLGRLRKQFAVELSLNEFFTHPTVGGQAVLVRERLADDAAAPGRAALEKSLLARRSASSHTDAIPPRDKSRPCPLSPAQERLWFLQQLNPDFRAYNEPEAARFRGPLHVGFLEEALNTVVARHEVLRTLIDSSGGRPVQVVLDSWRARITHIDLTSLAAEARQAELQRLLRDEPRRPFDLAAAPGIRAALVRCGLEDHVFIITLHHMMCDGWSLPILYHELSATYRAFCRGETPALNSDPLHYPDFAAWRARQVEERVFAKDLAFWKDYLRGAPPALDLPTKGPRPERFTYEGEKRSYPLGRDVADSLHRFSRHEEVSLFTVLAAAFNVLLSRYSGVDDVVLGIPIANRERPELLSLFGFLIDFQALRTDLSGDPTFRELLQRVRQGILDVNAHRAVPFNLVVEALNPPRDLSRAPLFQALLIWKDRHVQMQFMELEGLTTSHVQAHPGIAKYDLTVWLTDVEDDIWLEVEYCTDLFDADLIGQVVEAYRVLLKAIVADPEQHLANLPVLTPEVRQRLLVEWNDTRADYPRHSCVHELIEAQAAKTPGEVAVIMGDRQLTYAELDARANRVARHLCGLGVVPGSLVGVCLERSPEMVVAVLAVLKAGAAYVPLDPDFPPKRLADMVADSAPACLLTQAALLDRLPPSGARVILLDDMTADLGGAAPVGPTASPEGPAYVLYTSGSTGRTKGVVVPHRAVVNLLTAMARETGISSGDVLLAVTTLSFDIATLELFLPLTVGGRVLLASRDVVIDGPRLAELLDRSRPTVMQATPATWRMVIDSGWRGDGRMKILCGGEALAPALAEALLARCGSLWNAYGPTETTIYSTCERIETVRDDRVPIGRPIANTRTYVLDAHGLPTPPAVPGELYIGGDGVAVGYLNRPELTAERFIPDPFADEPGAWMYRTGDRARYLPDGRIEFLGRLDNQVKVRGFRIELGEIEAVLERHPAVRQAVAVLHRGPDGDGQLAVYIVACEATPSAAELREHLRACLPDYMIPAAFVPMETLPLTPSGKVDRKALPVPGSIGLETREDYAAPRTPIEEGLAAIWADLLGRERVGINDNFFDLGGHSLLAVRLFAEIEKSFGRRLPLALLFEEATIKYLAKKVQNPAPSGYRIEVIAIQPDGFKPRLFFLPSLVGEVMYCCQLARHLGPDQPVYGIQMFCGDGATNPLASIEAVAARCVEELCAFQPEGPYRLAGYSFAGRLAYEMARQLQVAGYAVDLTAIIDTSATYRPNGQGGRLFRRVLDFLCNLPYWVIDDLLRTPPAELLVRIRRQIRTMQNGRTVFNSSFLASGGLELEDLFDLGRASGAYLAMMKANLKAFQEYTPQPYQGRITLLRARARPLFHSHEADLGWGKYALGGVDIGRVPGNHNSILQEPFVKGLAAQLKSRLDREETPNGSIRMYEELVR